MPLTPSDVQNVVFSRPRIGRRGYREDEVDVFLDLVADELVRHIKAEKDLRKRNAELRERNALLEKATADLREWDAKLRRRREELRQHEEAIRRKAHQLRRYETALTSQQRQLEAPRPHRQAALPQRAEPVRKRQPAVPARQDRQPAVPARQDLQPAAISEEHRITAVRAIAGAYGKHDLEWMAIRSVAERVGERMTETVQQEWTRTTNAEPPGGEVIPIESAQLQQLKQQNAELTRVNEMLKTLTALFASEVNGGNNKAQGQLGR